MYISFIRALIEYRDIIWDNCSAANKHWKTFKLRHKELPLEGGTKVCSMQKLYDDSKWETLETCRNYHTLYQLYKITKAFSKFYRRHFDIVSKYNVGLKTLLLQGLSDPEFYGDLVYKFRKIIGKTDFPYHFKKIVVRYKKIGYDINVMRQTACLVVNPIKVNSFAYLFNCTTVGRTSDWMMVPS